MPVQATLPKLQLVFRRLSKVRHPELFSCCRTGQQPKNSGFAGLLHGLPVSVCFHFFGLPVGDLSGLGVESYTVQKDFLVRELILFVVFLLFNLRKS